MDLNLRIGKEVNITITKGDTISFSANVLDKHVDPAIPFDFTGGSMLMRVKASKTAETSLLELNSDFEGGITLQSGLMVFEKDQSLAAGKYYYDLQYTDPNNIIKTWWFGKFIVVQDVS